MHNTKFRGFSIKSTMKEATELLAGQQYKQNFHSEWKIKLYCSARKSHSQKLGEEQKEISFVHRSVLKWKPLKSAWGCFLLSEQKNHNSLWTKTATLSENCFGLVNNNSIWSDFPSMQNTLFAVIFRKSICAESERRIMIEQFGKAESSDPSHKRPNHRQATLADFLFCGRTERSKTFLAIE